MKYYLIISILLAAATTVAVGAHASTITVMQGSDTLSASRSVINTNFANLNADKLATTTADYILYQMGTQTAALYTPTNTVISTSPSADVVLRAIANHATSTIGNAGADIYAKAGTYYLNATTALYGTTDAAGITYKLWGAGQGLTNFVVNNGADGFNLKGPVKVDFRNFTIYVKGASNGITASSITGYRSVWNSTFDGLMIKATTTDSTGWGIKFTNDFRNTYNNIQFLALGGCLRSGTEATNLFNNGDSVYQNMMCDLSGNANAGPRYGWYFDGSLGTSLVNQDTFTDVNTFSNFGSTTAWYFNHTKWMTLRGINSEGSPTTTEAYNGSENNVFEFEYEIGSTTPSVYHYFDATSFGNTIDCRYVNSYAGTHTLLSDANTQAYAANILKGVDGSVCVTHGSGTFSFATTSASIIRDLSANGSSYLDTVKVLGDSLVFNFVSGADQLIKSIGSKLEFFNNAILAIAIDSSGNVGINTASPTNLLDVNGVTRMRNNAFITQGNGGLFFTGSSAIFTHGLLKTTAGEMVIRAGGATNNVITVGTSTATTTANFVVAGSGNKLAVGAPGAQYFTAAVSGLVTIGYTPYSIYQDDYQSLVIQGGYPGYYAPRSILDLKAPDTNPQEATFTAERPVNGGCWNGSSYACREFMDIGLEDYSPEGPSTGKGPDHLAYIGINAQGSGTTTPFVIRFWDLDSQASVVNAQNAFWLDPTGAAALGDYASTTPGRAYVTKSYATTTALSILATTTTTKLLSLESTARTSVFQVTTAGLASTTNLTISGLGSGSSQCLQIGGTGIVSGTGAACAGAGAPFAWTPTSWGVATSTTIGLTNGFLANASSTISASTTITGVLTASGGIYGALTGNASTATALATPRAINGTNFDGTAAITITAASSTLLANSNTFSGTNNFTGNTGFGSSTPTNTLGVNGYVDVDGKSGGYKFDGNKFIYASSTNFATIMGIGAGTNLDATSTVVGDTAIGYQSLNTTPTNAATPGLNTAVGYQTMKARTSGFKNTSVGYKALTALTSGTNNTAMGNNAGLLLSSGTFNTLIGDSAGATISSGSFNTFLGQNAGSAGNASGGSNTGVGLSALAAVTGANNTALGTNAGVVVGAGASNVIVGRAAGALLTTGNNNTFIGTVSASTTVSGSRNIVIGYDLALPTNNGSNQLVIGNMIYGINLTSESSSTPAGSIGIGTSSPATALDVNGTITQLTVKSCTLGLTTDALGSITGCVSSDERLKKNIFPLASSLATLLKLSPVTYEWKDPAKDTQVHAGFVAQQVEKVFPQAVVSAGADTKGVDPNALIALVVRSIHDIEDQVTTLKAGVVVVKRSAEENWQWGALALLALVLLAQQVQIRRLRKATTG